MIKGGVRRLGLKKKKKEKEKESNAGVDTVHEG
jgi:hypothetical protein